MAASLTSLAVAFSTSRPQSRNGTSWLNCRQKSNPAPGESPNGSAVLARISRSNRLGCSAGQPQTDQPAPVLAEQVQRPVAPLGCGGGCFQEAAHPFDVARIGVGRALDGLVGAAEADQVRDHHPMPGAGQHRDHLAVQVAPGRLAMQQQDRGRAVVRVVRPVGVVRVVGVVRPVGVVVRPGHDVGHAQPVHGRIPGLVRVVVHVSEALLGSANERDAAGGRKGLSHAPTLVLREPVRLWNPTSV